MSTEHPAICRFQQYIRINSVHPNPDYGSCISFLQKQAEKIGLDFAIFEIVPQAETAICITWKGSQPDLKSIMLNSHMDVVPVDKSKWKYGPFDGVKDSEGNIYGRGTQDMKSVGMQYLEAIRILITEGFIPKRTIHVTFVPDEELGSKNGMAKIIQMQEFKNLNVGFGLDEAGACPTEQFLLFNAERALWQIRIKVRGNTGHALHFIENSAAEKSLKIMNAFAKFRETEKEKLKGNIMQLGDVHTVNMTMINGGMQPNVIAPEIVITYDIRITPERTEQEVEDFIETTCREAGTDISYEFINKDKLTEKTPLTSDNPWWTVFKETCDEMNLKLLPMTCPGATDARFLRQLGIPAFGFMPMNNTPVLLHDNNEFVNEKVFLNGIGIYANLIRKLSLAIN